MNRFRRTSHISMDFVWKLFTAVLFLAFFLFFFRGIYTVDSSTTSEQAKSLEQAIRRGVVQCYCVEGTYPPSLDYLTEHYGIYYDTDAFFVDYTAIGSNIMPDITIIPKEISE